MKAVTIFLVYSAILSGAFSFKFEKCRRNSFDFDECVKAAVNPGVAKLGIAIPELNLPRIDPVEIETLNIPPGVHGVLQGEQKQKDCRLYGLSAGAFNKIIFNFASKNFYYEFNVDNVKLLCYYEYDSKIFTLPVFGNGRVTYDADGYKVRSNSTWVETAKSGKTYLQFGAPHTFTMDLSALRFNYANLFNGDKIRGKHMNKLMSDHWAPLYADVREEYEKAFGVIFNNLFNQIFSKTSIEDIFD